MTFEFLEFEFNFETEGMKPCRLRVGENQMIGYGGKANLSLR